MNSMNGPGHDNEMHTAYGVSDRKRNELFRNLRPLDALLADNRSAILDTAARYGAHNVRVFGSVARGDADEASDIDLLVDLEPGRSLFDLGGLLMDLRELLGRDVDVITENSLKPRIRERVLREARPL